MSQSTFAFRDPRPSFAGRIQNVTVNIGRDATLECPVNHLGRYKVSTNLKKWLFQSDVHQLHIKTFLYFVGWMGKSKRPNNFSLTS